MLPLQKILCPTDFSPSSDEALRVAVELAEHFGAELVLAHIVSPVPLPPPSMASRFDVKSYRREVLQSGLASLEEAARAHLPPAVRRRGVVAAGEAAPEIVRLAAEEHADLIVIATAGRGGWRRFVTGSVTEKVVRLAHCPVMVIQGRPATATP